MIDDPTRELTKEPFVEGMDTIIDNLTRRIAGAAKGFRLRFSDAPFRGEATALLLQRPENGGHWYYDTRNDLEGWLCPALLRYFRAAPDLIHVGVEPKRRRR